MKIEFGVENCRGNAFELQFVKEYVAESIDMHVDPRRP